MLLYKIRVIYLASNIALFITGIWEVWYFYLLRYSATQSILCCCIALQQYLKYCMSLCCAIAICREWKVPVLKCVNLQEIACHKKCRVYYVTVLSDNGRQRRVCKFLWTNIEKLCPHFFILSFRALHKFFWQRFCADFAIFCRFRGTKLSGEGPSWTDFFLSWKFGSHSTPLIETSYILTLRAARTLLERFRRKSYGFNTKFTHVSRHFWT